MIDVALLASIVVMVVVPAYFVPPWPPQGATAGLLDATLGALLVGVVVGRLTALAIDDPGSLTSLTDIMILRSGVEFWPGLIAGVGWLAVGARRAGVPMMTRLAAVSVPALASWVLYEATCVVRDGCPGPVTTIGLRPEGLTERMLPIGLLVAAVGAGCAFVIRRCQRSGLPHLQTILLAVGAVGSIRTIASFWLPHIGTGLTRQHRESIIIAAITAFGFLVVRRQARSALQAVTA